MMQTTLARPQQLSGIGLHSGKEVRLTLSPAAADSGIIFELNGPDGKHQIRPRPNTVSATALATTLSEGEAKVSTVEHILAALAGLSIDNVLVQVEGLEIPIVDGSAAPFVQALRKAGLRKLSSPRRNALVMQSVVVEHEGKSIRAWQHDGFFVDYTIDFAHPSIGRQRYSLEITPDSFSEIASARTFGFVKEVEYMHSRGLALGGSLDNAVVLGDQGVINPGGLRFADEFVRHKMLDFVGDMAMLGLPLRGAFEVRYSGHHLNNLFLRHLVEQPGALMISRSASARSYLETLPQPRLVTALSA